MIQALADSNTCRLGLMIFKAGFARGSADREVRPLPVAAEDRNALMQFGPPEQSRHMEDQDAIKGFYMWGLKKGNEQVNTELLALGSIRAATLPGPTLYLFCFCRFCFAKITCLF